MLGSRALIIFGLLTAAATAQTVHVVDPGALPGTAFTTIPDAVFAAAPGDTIYVRANNYGALRLTKGVTIVADPGTLLVGGFEITGIPAGQTAVLRGFSTLFAHPIADLGFSIVNNQGGVYLEDITYGSFVRPIIDTNAEVGLLRCEIRDAADGILVVTSNVWFAGCVLSPRTAIGFNVMSPPGIDAITSKILLSQCNLSGSITTNIGVSAGPALRMASSEVQLGRDTWVQAGVDTANTPMWAIETVSGALYVDSTARVDGRYGAAPITGPVVPVARDVATVFASPANWNNQVTVGIVSHPNKIWTILFMIPGPPIATPLGDFWGTTPVAEILNGTAVRDSISFAVAQSVPLGLHLGFQGVTLDTTNGRAQLTSPSFLCVGR